MLPDNFTVVDAIASILIIIGGAQGFIRGLSGELARLLGAVCAFVAGALLHEPIGTWIAAHTRLADQTAHILTYTVTVLSALILWNLLHKLLKKCLLLLVSVKFDKAAGVIAGMIRMTTLIGIIFIAMHIWPQAPFKEHVGTASFFGRQAIRLVPAVQQKLDDHNINLQRDPEPSDTGNNTHQHDKEEL